MPIDDELAVVRFDGREIVYLDSGVPLEGSDFKKPNPIDFCFQATYTLHRQTEPDQQSEGCDHRQSPPFVISEVL